MDREKYIISFGILPSIRTEEEFNIVADFFRLLKENFKEVYYTLPREGMPKRLKLYEDKLYRLMEDLGIQEHHGVSRNNLFIEEDDENSLEGIFGDDIRFIRFGILRLKYLENALNEKISFAKNSYEKKELKNDLEKYRKIAKRFLSKIDKQENSHTEDKNKQIPQVKTSTLYIHLDLANFLPTRKNTWDDLRIWAEFLNSVISITRTRLKHKGNYKVIAYLESYFKPRTTKEIEYLKNFIEERLSEDVKQTFGNEEEFVITFINFLTKIMGFDIEISTKEAEQAIPDKIMELKKQELDSLHAILSDDKGRDTTECDLRVVYNELSKNRVKMRGKAKDVISLEEFVFDPFIRWFFVFEGNIQTDDIQTDEALKIQTTYDLEDIKAELEYFSLSSNSDKTRIILGMLYHYLKNQEEFKSFWIDLEAGIKDSFYENLKEYNFRVLKIKILLSLYEIEDDAEKKREIISLLKESGLEEEIIGILSLKTDEEDLENEFKSLKRRFSDKIELNKKIQSLKRDIEDIKKIARDENINEERKNNLEEQLRKLQTDYENLKKIIQNYENQINDLQQNIQVLEEQKKNLEETIQKRNEKKDKQQIEIKNLEEQINTLDLDIKLKKDNIQKLTEQKDELDKQLQALTMEKDKLQKEIENLKLSEKKTRENINNLQEEKQKLENKVSELKPKIEQLKEEIEQRKQELAEYEEIQKTYNKLIQKEKMEKYIQERKEELQSLEQDINNLKEDIEVLNKKIDLDKQTLKDKQEEVKKLSKDREKLEKNVKEMESEKQELKGKIKILEKNKEEYTAIIEELKKRKNSLQEYEKIYKDKSQEIKKLINQIDNFIKTLS